MELPSRVEDLPYLDERKNPSLQQLRLPKLFNDWKLKCLGKREENGVSTQHVISVISYAHIQEKYAKWELLVKSCPSTPLRTYAQPIVKEVKCISTFLNK